MKCLGLFAAFLLLPHLAAGQGPADSAPSESLPVPHWAKSTVDSFSKPLHPLVGGVAPGSGLGVGIGYTTPSVRPWFRDASARVSINRYWAIEGETGVRSTRSQIGAFGELRDMNRMDYYGLGPDSQRRDRSDFRLRETTIGTRGWFRPAPALRLGGSAAMYAPKLGEGSNPSVLDITQVFAGRGAPELNPQPTFGRYRGYALLTSSIDDPTGGDLTDEGYLGTYKLALEAVRDLDTGRHDFHRWEAEIQQRIPGVGPGQKLTLHGLVAATNAGSDVPFYMLYTLGGSGGLKAFLPEMVGTDGSRATLRSFRNYRFRDRSLLLMQAEYRIPIMKAVHATVFVDAGQVAPQVSDLFNRVRTGTGFSLGYVRKGITLGRVDVGYGSGEGMQLFWSFGVLGQ